MVSRKTSAELPNHVHFRVSSDDRLHVKGPSSFFTFDFNSAYVCGFNPLDQLLCKVAVPVSSEKEPKPDAACNNKFSQ